MILYPGSSTVVERDFDPSENSVTVVAKDYNGLTIPTTAAVKIDSNTWRTTITIPDVAPVCSPTSGYYKLVWTFSTGTVEHEFQVVAYDEGVQRPPPAGFGVVGIALTDEVYLPQGATEIKCEIVNSAGVVVIEHNDNNITENNVTSPTPNSPGSVKATAEFNPPGIGVGEYIAHWSYKVGGSPAHEFRQAFVVSLKTSSLLSSMRMYIDQSQVTRWLAHLQFTDPELVDCLYRGTDRINAHPPQVTGFTPDTMPSSLAHALRVCALHEMLNRLYLAEGMSTFDFQGGSVSVSTDRTPFIQTKMDELNNWIDNTLKDAKQLTLSRSSLGITHVTVSHGGINNNYANAGGGRVRPTEFMLSRGNYGAGLIDTGTN